MKIGKKQLRNWSEALVERVLGVKVYRAPPFGVDSYAQIRHLFSWSPGDVVFDVGANDGRTVVRVYQYLPSPAVFAFEPVLSTFQTLVQRTKQFENVRCFPLALGEKTGSEKIYLHERAIMNSFSPQWYEPIGTETVEMTTVDQVMGEQEIDFIHLLKIDTEGYELEVLKGAQEALATSRIAIVQVEVGFDQQVSPHIPLEQVRRHLAPMGYFLHGVFNQRGTSKRVCRPAEWEDRPLAMYRPSLLKLCDAVFIRADLTSSCKVC